MKYFQKTMVSFYLMCLVLKIWVLSEQALYIYTVLLPKPLTESIVLISLNQFEIYWEVIPDDSVLLDLNTNQ